MSKVKNLLAGLVMALAMVVLPQSVMAAEQIPTAVVEDITDIQNVSSTVFEVGTGEYSNTVQFTLDKPSYVYVSAYSSVCSYGSWTYNGYIQEFGVYTDANCSNLVTGEEVGKIPGNKQANKYLCLDAGTYWIRFAKAAGNASNETSYGEFRLTVAAEYLDLTATKNGSWNRATKISTDKKVTGLLSGTTRTNWFKFTVAAGTSAKINISLENPLGADKFPLSNTGVTVYRSNRKVLERVNIGENYYESANTNTLTLSQGTYYIGVTGDSSYGTYSWNNTKLVDNSYHNMGVVSLKVITVKKATISKVSNVKGKKAQVTYKKVTGAKGYEIQYSTSKNFKSGVKTKKVGASTKKVTLTKLTKNKKYYVRVRAYKYDEDGNKVYGAWSNAKNVKISK